MTTNLRLVANPAERDYLISSGFQHDDNLQEWIKTKGDFKAVISDGTSAIGVLFAVQLFDARTGASCDTQSNRNVHSAVAAANMMLAYRIADAELRR